MLSQASDDLRKSLADNNVNLLSLDVSTSGDQQQEAAGFSAGFGPDGSQRGGMAPSRGLRGDSGSDDDALAAPLAETTLELPNGVLVDVLA